ncbi:MAG: helix-turn-helix domain-containing protein [Capsulimonadaceae bacterium]|nr:helix-turn-helix domain-containing protein [Capsulimonadaceae bacterium]
MMSIDQKLGPSRWDPAGLAELHQIYALRAQIASFAARHAALHVAAGLDPAPLRLRWDAMRDAGAKGDYSAFLEADMQFHRTIAAMAGTPGLDEIWLVLEERFRIFAGWSHHALFRDLKMLAQSHDTQLKTIASGDAVAAQRAAQVDLDALWQILTEQPAEATGEADPVERVAAYVVLNLHRRLTLTEVARDVAFVSPSHLARLFRQRRNESFSTFVQGLRLRRAATLLQDVDSTVQVVADRVGYADMSRFTLHFRRLMGCTPSEWRKNRAATGR